MNSCSLKDDYLTSHPSLSPSAFMTMKEAKEFVNKCNAEAKAIKEEVRSFVPMSVPLLLLLYYL